MKTYAGNSRCSARQIEWSSGPFTWVWGGILALALIAGAAVAHAKVAPDGFADLAEKLLPSVVNISTTQVVKGRGGIELPQLPPGAPFDDFFKEFFDRGHPEQRRRKATSLGSGFILDNAGHVLTNNHVIEGADEITVILQDDTRLKAKVVGRDPKIDIAVLKVKPANGMHPVKFGDSDVTRVGDWVVAIGNPFGLGGTVTAGIISARGRDINAGPYDDFLQTDASINRGNSGGPMFNLKGEVIGINTAIYSPTGGSVGIGFAIPSAVAEPAIKQLIKSGHVRRGWLGVHIQVVSEEIAESLGLEKAEGALVASVIEDGPAKKSGIHAGDIILEFDNKKVTHMRRLPRIVAESNIEKPVSVLIWRDSKKVTIKVTVGELEEGQHNVASRGDDLGKDADDGKHKVKELGLALSSATKRLRERFNLDDQIKGVVVVSVDEEGPAAQKGIRPGDVIVEMSQNEVTTPDDVLEILKKARESGRRSVLMLLDGQKGVRFVAVRIASG